MSTPEDDVEGTTGPPAVGGPLVPIVPPAGPPDPRDVERAATAKRNKESLAQLGRRAAGLAKTATDATGSAVQDVVQEGVQRTSQAASAVRDSVTGAVSSATASNAPETAAGSLGPSIVVRAPGEPTTSGTVRVVPTGTPGAGMAGPGTAGTGTAGTGTAGIATQGPSPTASSVAIPSAGGDTRFSVASVASAAQQAAQDAGTRAAATGQTALDKGRDLLGSGRQAAAVGGRQAAATAQDTAASLQQSAGDALAATRSTLAGALDSGRSALRERTAPPIDLEGLAAEVLRLPGVARLAPDVAGRGRGLLPGQVAGAMVTDSEVRVRLVAHYGARLPELTDRVHDVADRYAEGRRTVVEVADLDLTDQDEKGTP